MANEDFSSMSLDEFNVVVDNITKDIEEGRLAGKQIAPIKQELTVEDTVDEGSATEMSESEMIAAATQEVEKQEVQENTTDIIGKPGKQLVIVTDKEGKETVYGNASACAKAVGLNPTTIRNRCKDEKVDTIGNLWSYRENDNI